MFIPSDTYKKIIDYMVIPTTDIVFLNKNKEILLWLRNNAPLKWIYYLPGWRIQKWETIIQAAKRKAKEELNIDIDQEKLKFIGVYDDIFNDSAFDNLSTHCLPCTFLYMLSEYEEQNLKPDNQHEHMRFFAYNEESFHPFLKKRLKQIQSVYSIF